MMMRRTWPALVTAVLTACQPKAVGPDHTTTTATGVEEGGTDTTVTGTASMSSSATANTTAIAGETTTSGTLGTTTSGTGGTDATTSPVTGGTDATTSPVTGTEATTSPVTGSDSSGSAPPWVPCEELICAPGEVCVVPGKVCVFWDTEGCGNGDIDDPCADDEPGPPPFCAVLTPSCEDNIEFCELCSDGCGINMFEDGVLNCGPAFCHCP